MTPDRWHLTEQDRKMLAVLHVAADDAEVAVDRVRVPGWKESARQLKAAPLNAGQTAEIHRLFADLVHTQKLYCAALNSDAQARAELRYMRRERNRWLTAFVGLVAVLALAAWWRVW